MRSVCFSFFRNRLREKNTRKGSIEQVSQVTGEPMVKRLLQVLQEQAAVIMNGRKLVEQN
jgi:hypothetical protein